MSSPVLQKSLDRWVWREREHLANWISSLEVKTQAKYIFLSSFSLWQLKISRYWFCIFKRAIFAEQQQQQQQQQQVSAQFRVMKHTHIFIPIDAHGWKSTGVGRVDPWGAGVGAMPFRQNYWGSSISGFIAFLLSSFFKFTCGSSVIPLFPLPCVHLYLWITISPCL